MVSDYNELDDSRDEPCKIVTVLDVGMYAETASTLFNGVPCLATALVCGETVKLIKERETVEDAFAKCRMPDRLRPDA